MKKTVLSLTLLSATLFHAAARADDPKPAVPPAPSADQAALLKKYDLNGDGKLDEAELAAAHKSMLKENLSGATANPRLNKFRAAMLKRFDRNGDGHLDANERAEMRKWLLERFDTNHDGRLDEDERAAMREAFKAEAKALKLKN